MKKILMVIGGIVVGILVLGVVIFGVTSLTSKKLVCKSSEGNITIMYNDKIITGYTANGISYDLANQQKYADQVGIYAYMKKFSTWFSSNTTGICK